VFKFTSEADSTAECKLAPAYGWTDCTSAWTYGLAGQPDGTYTFSVRTTDVAGNLGAVATRSFTLKRPVAPAPEETPAETQRPAVETPAGPLLRAGVCINLFMGTAKPDALSGSAFGDVLTGLGGNDRLAGAAGDDCVLGDDGNDRLSGGPGNDDVRGLRGDDVVRGDAGNDQVLGGPGADTLVGGTGTDTLKGGPGNDRLDAADGRRETVACGPGRDSVKADRSDRLTGCEKKSLRGRKR
jgi:hypothetical protein